MTLHQKAAMLFSLLALTTGQSAVICQPVNIDVDRKLVFQTMSTAAQLIGQQ